MIAICLFVIACCLVALAVVLAVHFTQARRDAYWQVRAERLADHLAEQQFRAAGVAQAITLAKARVISSRGQDRASANGSISKLQAELNSATWTRG
jgi:hypothetical protein